MNLAHRDLLTVVNTKSVTQTKDAAFDPADGHAQAELLEAELGFPL